MEIKYSKSVLLLTEHTGSSFLWSYSSVGRGTRRVIPSCVVAAVCHGFLETEGVHTGFKLAEL